MAVNFSTTVYLPAMNTFSVPATFYPIISNPMAGAYTERGIFSTQSLDVVAEDNSIISTQRNLFDILDAEFSVLPQQGDHVVIPHDCNGAPLGEFEIVDASSNGGGQTTLIIQKYVG